MPVLHLSLIHISTPFCSYTSWVNDPPGSAAMDAPERDHWTSLCEIPTPKNRTDTRHSAPHLLTCYPKNPNPWLRSCQIFDRYVSPFSANWAAFSRYCAHTHTYSTYRKVNIFFKNLLSHLSEKFKLKSYIKKFSSLVFCYKKLNQLNIS